MNYLHLLFLFVFLLASCHSKQEVCTQESYVQEIARSDVTIADVDTYLRNIVNRNVLITLEDVVVQYSVDDSSKAHTTVPPNIRSPAKPANLSIGKISLSDNSTESNELIVDDNTRQSSYSHSSESADLVQHEKKESDKLRPSMKSVLLFSICFSVVLILTVLFILYRKGKLRL